MQFQEMCMHINIWTHSNTQHMHASDMTACPAHPFYYAVAGSHWGPHLGIHLRLLQYKWSMFLWSLLKHLMHMNTHNCTQLKGRRGHQLS